jgi:diketogulonate reductase-like aldo/keto reductase
MVTKPIPVSGEQLPVIGLGTWQTFDIGKAPAERAARSEVLGAFVESGGTLVDSSPMYGASEEVVGDIARDLGLRPKLFIATKVWTKGKQAGIDQMRDSMRKLGTDVVDLMQVHNLLDVHTHLDTLEEWKHQGIVRYIGITHYTAAGAEELVRVLGKRRVDFVQINYSVAERAAEDRRFPMTRDLGIAVLANLPLGGGKLLRRFSTRPLPEWAAEIDCTSWSQILLKFVVSHPAVTCAIPATSKTAHLHDNMRAGRSLIRDERLRARIGAEL